MFLQRLIPTLTAALMAMPAATLASQTKAPAVPAPKPAPKSAPKAKKFHMIPPDPATLVDLNKAPKAELMKLQGITEAYAGKIIAGRPFHSKADLVTHRILPIEVYMAVKSQIEVNFNKP